MGRHLQPCESAGTFVGEAGGGRVGMVAGCGDGRKEEGTDEPWWKELYPAIGM